MDPFTLAMSTASHNTKTPIAATKPAAGYIGGKRNLAGRIVPIIDGTEHDGYAEPFVGMGGIFLRRRLRPRGCYEPAAIAAACFIMMQAKATT